MFTKFLKDRKGATAIEYTLLAALIGVALIGVLQSLEGAIDGMLNTAITALN
ncbi:MAG: Flp family type IVb pilin [Neomegalonema sp.]|nr:Flp family type IVb pilin [Neomegalonema sp.]